MKNIQLRPATQDDYDFVYEVKKLALGPYIEKTWGWDEEQQIELHKKDFTPEYLKIILREDEQIGILRVVEEPEKIYLHQIYILPDYQRGGIGTYLIKEVIEQARENGRILTLQFLKANPVRDLYERLGFKVVGQDEYHIQMEWEG